LNLLLRDKLVRQFFGGGGGGGGGGNREGEVTSRMNNYVAQTEADANRLINAVTSLGSELKRDAQNLSQDYLKGLSEEEKTALKRLDLANNFLADETKRSSDNFASEFRKALEDLDAASKTLNLGQRDEITAQIGQFKTEAQDLDARLRTDVSTALDRMDTGATAAVDSFRGESLGLADTFAQAGRDFRTDSEKLSDTFRGDIGNFRSDSDRLSEQSRADAERFRSDSLALGDQFRTDSAAFRADSDRLGDRYLGAAGAAMDEYRSILDEAGNLTPERLNVFSRAADFISQAAVQTRANMLASADPRALELSAIADENAAAMMSGRISADTQANLARSSAMRALQGGFGASGEMGRGLTARDLGLTSLDLQRQGMNDFERQRTLNYNTRVAGLQTDATGLLRDNQQILQNRANALLESGLSTAQSDRNQRQATLDTGLRAAESDRNQRQDIFGTVLQAGDSDIARRQTVLATGLDAARDDINRRQGVLNTGLQTAESDRNQRQGIFDTTLGARLANVDTRRAEEVGTARGLYDTGMNRAANVLGLNIQNTGTFFDNERARAQTRFNANTGLSGRLFDVGLNTAGTLYGTNVNANNAFYNTGVNALGSVFGTRMQASGTAISMRDVAERQKLAAMTQVRSNAAAMIEQAAEADYQQRMAAQASNNSMWGSIIGTGATVLGGAAGLIATGGNPMGAMAGATLGGMAGQAASGSLGYGGSRGGAQGMEQGMSAVGMFSSALGGRAGRTGSSFGSMGAAQSAAPYASSFSAPKTYNFNSSTPSIPGFF
jgi:hypothetical protein